MNQSTNRTEKLIAVVAYATIIGTIIAIFMNLERKMGLRVFIFVRLLGSLYCSTFWGFWSLILIVG